MVARGVERIAYPLTFLFRQEGEEWSSLACEIDVASCGGTLEEAREGLKEAVELYVSHMLEQGMRDRIGRPVPEEALREFMSEGEGPPRTEYHTLLVTLAAVPEMEFVPSEIAPVARRPAAATR
jgi:predicted RNase H-like HicB family nuclease